MSRAISTVGGARVISGLGGIFIGLGIVQVRRDLLTNAPVHEVVADLILFAIPAIALLYGGYWIRRSDIHPDRYPRIAGWCLGGLTVMFVISGVLVLTAGLPQPLRAIGVDAAIGGVGGVGVGVMEARAITRAEEAERREQELRERKTELRTLIELLPVAVFVAEADGRIVEWNEAAEAIWGGEIAESESVEEYEQYEAWWAETGERLEPEEWPLARALRGEEVTDADEIVIKGFDGEFRTVLNHGMPVRGADGEVRRAVVTLIDISDLKEYQRRLEESNERLEQFAYAASHDLQEPLRMVSSYLQLLENRYADDLDDEGREYIDFAVGGADRMREMIDALLKYSRVDKDEGSFEPVDLKSVLADARRDLRMRIEEHDAEIAADSLPTVRGDEEQLRHVFQNLLDNAIEYSGAAPPRVEVSAERRGDEWVIAVRDEGIGIDPDDQERIFDVFERLHAPNEHEGTGIGLALCERIVERHGGEMWVDSVPGEGSTFYFTVPLEADAPNDFSGPSAARRTPNHLAE